MHIGPSDISIAKDVSCFIFLSENLVAYTFPFSEGPTHRGRGVPKNFHLHDTREIIVPLRIRK